MITTTYLLLGSNIGDRERFLSDARDQISSIEGLEIIAMSAIYNTEPVAMEGENPPFLNQVVMAEYQFRPLELLGELETIERLLGREASEKGMHRPRTIDLDILLFGEEQLKSDRLTIPHRELTKRPFALIPLVEINPDITHPLTHKPLAGFIKPTDYNQVILYKDYVARNI